MGKTGKVYTNIPINKKSYSGSASPTLLFLLATVCATAVSARMFYPMPLLADKTFIPQSSDAVTESAVSAVISAPAVTPVFAENTEIIYETEEALALPEEALPLCGQITSGFSARCDPFGSGATEYHLGIDIAPKDDLSVAAWRCGEVTVCEYDESYGNYIIIDHGGGISSLYAHLEKSFTECGDRVEAGENIGNAGSTGRSTGVHLHFEIRNGNDRVDPLGYLYRLLI